ncbi:hypothetical protein D9M68_856330 [compost metagenome]
MFQVISQVIGGFHHGYYPDLPVLIYGDAINLETQLQVGVFLIQAPFLPNVSYQYVNVLCKSRTQNAP